MKSLRLLKKVCLLSLLGIAAGLILVATRPQTLQQRASRGWKDLHFTYPCLPTRAWLKDGRRWVELHLPSGNDAGFYNPTSPTIFTTLESMDAPERHDVILGLPATTHALLGVLPDKRLLAATLDPGSHTHADVDLYDLGLYPNDQPLRTHHIGIPAAFDVQDLVLSPKGDRIAWRVIYRRQSPAGPLLQRIRASWGRLFPVEQGVGLWTSRIDGSDRTEIGYQSGAQTRLTGLCWTEDGTRLCFDLDDVPYSVRSE